MVTKKQDRSGGLKSEQDILKSKCDELLNGLLKGKEVNQVIAAIESGDGLFRWSAVVNRGELDPEEHDVGSPFWIASVTKLFIAAAVLKLHEQKQLFIDQPAAEYLPKGLIDGLHRTKGGVDLSAQITTRHLLSHTSGLPDYLEIKPKGGKSIFDAVFEEGDRVWKIEDMMQIVREAGSPLFAPQPHDQPVKKARYSDTNYQLLIALIEAVSKKSMAAVFREMFYEPLGMKATYHPGSLPDDPGLPGAVPVWGGDKILDLPLAMQSFGDLYSTTADLLLFLRALINGVIFDNQKTAELMRSNWNRFGFMISPVAPGWPIEYGLGMMRFEMPRFATPFKAVPAVIGHTGACGSWLFYCPELDIYLVGSANQLMAAAAPFRFIPGVLRLLKSRKS